jgi:peptidoglycan hydrolase CwlO-like protein
MEKAKFENGTKKWITRLSLAVLIITITTFINQIFAKYYTDLGSQQIAKLQIEEVCKKVSLLEDKIENIEKQINEMNLKRETSMIEIKSQLTLILEKINSKPVTSDKNILPTLQIE